MNKRLAGWLASEKREKMVDVREASWKQTPLLHNRILVVMRICRASRRLRNLDSDDAKDKAMTTGH